MTHRRYPDERAGDFPRPPATVTDHNSREIEIRAVDVDVEEDREPLVEMYLDFDPQDRAQGIPPVQEDEIRSWLDILLAPDCLNLVALSDDNYIGHATLVPDDAEGYELAIFVLDSDQGVGIGTHLLKHLLGHAQNNDVEYIWLTVERWNDAAIALYRKVGFEMCSTESFEMEMSIRL